MQAHRITESERTSVVKRLSPLYLRLTIDLIESLDSRDFTKILKVFNLDLSPSSNTTTLACREMLGNPFLILDHLCPEHIRTIYKILFVCSSSPHGKTKFRQILNVSPFFFFF